MEARYNAARISGHLDVNNLRLGELPELPGNLVYLHCSGNKLTKLPKLPNTLVHLDCSVNKLTQLPELPNTLEHLNCSANTLTQLPELPNTLVDLICVKNNLSQLPKLPDLQTLDCSRNTLSVLPPLPDSLEELVCDFNALTTLPEKLPPDLQSLEVAHNKLTKLPELPNTLNALYCSMNKLQTLPHLPESLETLDIAENPFEPGLQAVVKDPPVKEALWALGEYGDVPGATEYVIERLNRYNKQKKIRNMAKNVATLNTLSRKKGVMTVRNTKNIPKNVLLHVGRYLHNEGPNPNFKTIRNKLKIRHNTVTRKHRRR